MNADTFRTLAVVFLALAIVLAVVAVILYRVFDIRAVRDALTGRTAAREIADLRGVRAGSWQHADEFGRRGSKRSDTTGGTGSHETSDIAFRPVTGTGSGSLPTEDGETRTGAGERLDAPAAKPAKSAKRPHKNAGGAAAPVSGAKDDNGNPLVEIPVNLASAAELADEGETSLMQFRKTDQHTTDDDDESRTILVRGGKSK
ncbi:hypothetical protein [Bifidobacterium saguinibicoloris]|uniref:hypothetical protein n=1 Tax=Bifidobacterium saguinibicoloris TaxID=2834433 RepID=UPI001C560856|nr:hypothetical protein [Bifidobacterium saguinibicoloris]MBW3081227.1 hypothetical protein [Bifidobacterium saguinibicoloris]